MPRPAPRPLTASPENRLEEKEEKEVRNTGTLENNTHIFNTNTIWGCNPNPASRKTLTPFWRVLGNGERETWRPLRRVRGATECAVLTAQTGLRNPVADRGEVFYLFFWFSKNVSVTIFILRGSWKRKGRGMLNEKRLCVELDISGAHYWLYWHLFPKVTLIQLGLVSHKWQPLGGEKWEASTYTADLISGGINSVSYKQRVWVLNPSLIFYWA